MATETITTFRHTCDLCGEQRDEEDLTRFEIRARTTTAKAVLFRETRTGADVCPGCLSRPASEVKAFIEAEMDRKGLEHLTAGAA